MLNDMPVIDAVIHPANLHPSNYATDLGRQIAEMLYTTGEVTAAKGYHPKRDSYFRDWTIEEMANLLFLETDTDLAVNHVLPLFAFKDGMCSFDKALEAKERWPDRFITYCGIDPTKGDSAMAEMERQIETLDPVGLKLYPNRWMAEEHTGWKMDDPEIAFPFFQRAQELGIGVVAVHKALPLGPVPMEFFRMDDIDRAAIAFPNMKFEVIHGGMAFVEETAWQLARFENVFVNLEITTSLLGNRPAAFGQALATMISAGGDFALEKICWGTGSMAFHPQPLLEAFERFQFTDHQREMGAPEMTEAMRRKILAENYANLIGLDLDARLAAIADDEFAQRRADGVLEPFSTTESAGMAA